MGRVFNYLHDPLSRFSNINLINLQLGFSRQILSIVCCGCHVDYVAIMFRVTDSVFMNKDSKIMLILSILMITFSVIGRSTFRFICYAQTNHQKSRFEPLSSDSISPPTQTSARPPSHPPRPAACTASQHPPPKQRRIGIRRNSPPPRTRADPPCPICASLDTLSYSSITGSTALACFPRSNLA